MEIFVIAITFLAVCGMLIEIIRGMVKIEIKEADHERLL